MKQGKNPDDILKEPCNVANLEDTFMDEDEAIRIACHVVFGLYDGVYPKCGVECERCVVRDACQYYITYGGTNDN